jgi:hypothetical protein
MAGLKKAMRAGTAPLRVKRVNAAEVRRSFVIVIEHDHIANLSTLTHRCFPCFALSPASSR